MNENLAQKAFKTESVIWWQWQEEKVQKSDIWEQKHQCTGMKSFQYIFIHNTTIAKSNHCRKSDFSLIQACSDQ
jgi:hypothetical protein